MLVWSVTIPMFWVFTVWNVAEGHLSFGRAAQRAGTALLPFSWALPLVNCVVIVVSIIVMFPTLLALL
jgi:hypothetical protein